MNNSLYFRDKLNDKELKTICQSLRFGETITLKEAIESKLYYSLISDSIVLISPLFYCDQISSDNPNDMVKENHIVCEYRENTLLTFGGEV